MIIADTGFWVALLDRRDGFHPVARNFAAHLNESLITTAPVLTEVCYLLQQKCGPRQAAEFLLTQQDGLFSLFSIDEKHLARCGKLMRQYENLPSYLSMKMSIS